MLPFNHMAASLMTAGRLARLDASAIDDFDTSPQGFWRSFYAAMLVAPLALMMALTHYRILVGDPGIEPSMTRFAIVELVAYVISWTAYPVLMASFVRYLGCERHYIRGIVAWNWATVLQNLLYVPVALAGMSGGGLGPLPFVVLVAVLIYGWFVAWKGFGIAKSQAVMLVGLDLSIGLMVSFWADRLLVG